MITSQLPASWESAWILGQALKRRPDFRGADTADYVLPDESSAFLRWSVSEHEVVLIRFGPACCRERFLKEVAALEIVDQSIYLLDLGEAPWKLEPTLSAIKVVLDEIEGQQ